jgi:hypothetical protein
MTGQDTQREKSPAGIKAPPLTPPESYASLLAARHSFTWQIATPAKDGHETPAFAWYADALRNHSYSGSRDGAGGADANASRRLRSALRLYSMVRRVCA